MQNSDIQKQGLCSQGAYIRVENTLINSHKNSINSIRQFMILKERIEIKRKGSKISEEGESEEVGPELQFLERVWSSHGICQALEEFVSQMEIVLTLLFPFSVPIWCRGFCP